MSSAEKFVVRPIRKRDFPRFFKVVRRAFGNEIEIMGLDLQRFSHIVRFYDFIDVVSHVLKVLNVHLPTILVAVSQENMVVGGVHIAPLSKEVWTIDSLAVDPSHTKLGIGVHLISAALKYVEDRGGRKALTYVRADNAPSLKIRRKLHGEFFDRRVFLILELNKIPEMRAGNDFVTREAKSEDSIDIYRLCRTIDPKKTATFEVSPKSFLNSKSELLISKVIRVHHRKWVLKNREEIIGYADVIFSSPQEAGKIEYFCLAGASDPVRSAAQLLNAVFQVLGKKKIRKVAVTLNEDWTEMIRIFESLGFERVASFYGVAHMLA